MSQVSPVLAENQRIETSPRVTADVGIWHTVPLCSLRISELKLAVLLAPAAAKTPTCSPVLAENQRIETLLGQVVGDLADGDVPLCSLRISELKPRGPGGLAAEAGLFPCAR